MDRLSPATIRRLRRLPQPRETVWEGDRLTLDTEIANTGLANSGIETTGQSEQPAEHQRADCFVWVNRSEQLVRGIDAAMAGDGPNAFVQSLLKAMEEPLGWPDEPAEPQRPSHIIVRDRELHFLLRGVLRDLEICVQYEPELPYVDQLLPGLCELMDMADDISEQLYKVLAEKAYDLWQVAPWKRLLDSEILSVEMKALGIDAPLYISVIGRLGLEQGLVIYRSLHALTCFREAIAQAGDRLAEMQAAFAAQDCLFLNYEPKVETPFVHKLRLVNEPNWDNIDLDFGSIHPSEGLRSRLDLTELSILYGTLEAVLRFWRSHHKKFSQGSFPPCKSRYKVAIPAALQPVENMEPVMITVKTQPVLARAFSPAPVN